MHLSEISVWVFPYRLRSIEPVATRSDSTVGPGRTFAVTLENELLLELLPVEASIDAHRRTFLGSVFGFSSTD